MLQAARVTVVSVAYNSMDVLPNMMASLPKNCHLVVVDNASADLAQLESLCEKHGTTLIKNTENLGFGIACNIGAKRAKTDFVFFLNPDTVLQSDTIEKLVEAGDKYPTVSAFNPRIARANGTQLFRYRSRIIPISDYMPKGWPEADKELTFLVGSAMFVRRSAFEAVDGFDENIFLYHEDDELSRRLRATQGPLMFVYDAFVTHLAEQSSGTSAETFHFKRYHAARSRVYSARKHGRSAPFLTALIGGILAMLAPDMLWSKTRRWKSWGILRGVLSTLQDGGKGRGAL
jgi:N-acetylglucosaminyl-diphospho-decaprenol L-rhamnosyltransferase